MAGRNAMRPPARALYLAREVYRRRRIMDAARLLPVLGMLLVALPMLWKPAEVPESATAWQGAYLFAAWFVLILGAWYLARALMPEIEDVPQPPEAGDAASPRTAADATATAGGPEHGPPEHGPEDAR